MSSARTVKPGEPVTYHATERQKIDIKFLGGAGALVEPPIDYACCDYCGESRDGSDPFLCARCARGNELDLKEEAAAPISGLPAASSSHYLELLSLLLVMPEAASVTLHGQEAELALCLFATANSLTMAKGDGFCRVSLRSGTTIESRRPAAAPRVVVDADARWSPASGQEMP